MDDLVDQLVSLYRPDGSWRNDRSDRWMADDPDLVTVYAFIALTQAIK